MNITSTLLWWLTIESGSGTQILTTLTVIIIFSVFVWLIIICSSLKWQFKNKLHLLIEKERKFFIIIIVVVPSSSIFESSTKNVNLLKKIIWNRKKLLKQKCQNCWVTVRTNLYCKCWVSTRKNVQCHRVESSSCWSQSLDKRHGPWSPLESQLLSRTGARKDSLFRFVKIPNCFTMETWEST